MKNILAGSIIGFFLVSPAMAEAPPSFQDYPVTEHFAGSPAEPVLSAPDARKFRTVLRDNAKSGPNLAGHFTLARWGCGAGCISWAIIDANSGVVWMAPFTVSDPAGVSDPKLQHSLNSQVDSELIVAVGSRNETGGGKYYYRWHDNKLSLITAIENEQK
jgi:hypothetical protein